MKRILIFSDSNGWGYEPVTGRRYGRKDRWPTVLADILGHDCFEVTEDCANGRTIAFDDPINTYRNGLKQIGASLYSHSPTDLLIVMLGINDIRTVYNAGGQYIARTLRALIEHARKEGTPGMRVLAVAPPVLKKEVFDGPLAMYYDPSSVTKGESLPRFFMAEAKKANADFFDASAHAVLSDADGVHMDADNHRKLAQAIADKVREILG